MTSRHTPKTVRPLTKSLAKLSSAAAVFAALFSSTSNAQITWDADSNPTFDLNWSNPLNWVGDVEPTVADAVIFPTAIPNPGGLANPQIIQLGATETALSLEFKNSYTLSAGDLALGIGANVTVDPTFTATISSKLTGANGLTKLGSGTLVISNSVANDYTGVTTVSGGVLNIRAATALGSTLAGSGTVVSSGAELQLEGSLAIGAEALTLNGAGIGGTSGALRSVSGTSSLSGAVTLATASTITADSGSALTLTGGINGSAAGTALSFGGAGDITVSTAVIGSNIGAINKSGGGTLNFAAQVNTFTGPINLSGGKLIANSGITTAADTGTLGNGGSINLSNNAILSLNLTGVGGIWDPASSRVISIGSGGGTIDSNRGITINDANQLTGSGTLTRTGANIASALNLAAASDFSGNAIVNSGTLQLSNSSGMGAGGVAQTITVNSGARYSVNSAATSAYAVTVNTGGIVGFDGGDTGTLGGTLNAAGNFSVQLNDFATTTNSRGGTISAPITGAGNMTVTNGGATAKTLTLSGGNTAYTGTVSAGANSIVTINGRLGSTAGLTLAGGTINYRGITGAAVGAQTGLQAFYYNFGFDPDVDNGASATRSEFASDLLAINPRAYTRIDSQIDIPNGGAGTYPTTPVVGYQYNVNDGVMWKGVLNIASGGSYQFSAINDDGATLFIDGVQVGTIGVTTTGGNIGSAVNLSAGAHTIVYKFGQGAGGGFSTLRYNGPDSSNNTVTVPGSAFSTLAATTQVGALTATGGTGNTLDISQPTEAASLSMGSGAALTVTSVGIDNLTIGGATTLNGGNVTFTSTTAGLIFNGAIGQSANTNVTFAGNYLKQINAGSTYVGNTSVTGGQLNLNAATGVAIPSGTVTLNVRENATTGTINTVNLLRNEQIANTAALVFTAPAANQGNVAILNLGAFDETIATLSMNGGQITGSGTLTLTNLSGSTFTAGSIEAALAGSGGLTKTGTGTLTLAGSNTYAGLTNVNAGTLSMRHGSALGASGAGNETNVGASGTVQVLGNLTSAETFNLANGTGFRVIGGDSTFSGKLTYGIGVTAATLNIASGTFHLNGAQSIDGTAGNTNLTINGNGELIVSNPIALGLGSLTKSGNGTLTFAYDTLGTLPTHDAGALGFSGPQTAAFVAPVSATKAYKFNSDPGVGTTITAAAGSTVIAGYAADQTLLSRFSAGSAGKLVLAANSANNLDFTGTDLSLGARGAITYSGVLTPNAGTYRLGGTFAGGDSLQNILALTQPLTGSNAVNISSGGIVDFTRLQNSFSGSTVVDGGTLQIASTDNLGAIGNSLTLSNGGTLRVATTSGNSGALYVDLGRFAPGGETRSISVGAGGGTIDVPTYTAGVTGLAIHGLNGLTGSAGTTLTKTGLGALYLTNSNSFAGNIVVAANGNQLDLRAGGALPNVSSITVNQSGILNLNSFNGLGRGAQAAQNIGRINDTAAMTFSGGTLFMKTPSNATLTETVGALTLNLGQANFNADTTIANDVQNGQIALTFASTTRNIGSTLRLGGNGPSYGAAAGNNSVRILLGDVNGSALSVGQILSFGTTFGQDILTQGANGLVAGTYTAQVTGTTATAFAPVAGTLYSINLPGSPTAGTTYSTTLAAGNQSLAGLKFNIGDSNETLGFTAASDTLFIGTSTSFGGAITAQGSSGSAARTVLIGATAGTGRITAGPSGATTPQELFLHLRNSSGGQTINYTMNASIVDNGASAPVTVVKSDDAGITFATANTYTGGTFINRGRITANVAGSLGTGAVTVKNSAITLPVAGTVAGSAVPLANPVFTITDQSELFLSGGVAYSNINERFDLGAGSNVAATSATAGQGLNSLTYIAPGAPFTAGGQIRLAPGAVVRTTGVVQNSDIGTFNMIQGLPNDASLYINMGNTSGDGTTLSLGAGTPWRGIGGGKAGPTFTAGTIFANSDFELNGNVADNGTVGVTLGSTGAGSYRIVNTAGKAINALISGTVVLTEGSQVTMPSDLTFVVSNGAVLQANLPSQFGTGANTAKVLVQAGGTLDPGTFVSVGTAANQAAGFAYPVESPVNANVTVEAAGRFLINDASGLGSSDKVVTLKKNSILQIGNSNAFFGSGDVLSGGTNTGLIRTGQISLEQGVVVRLEASNIYKLDQFVVNATNGNAAHYEVFNGDRTITTVTNPFTGLTEAVNYTLPSLVGDAGDNRQLSHGGFGGRITIADGGFIGGANGVYFGVADDLFVPSGTTLKIGSPLVIDGLQRLGGVHLNANNSGQLDGTIAIQDGAQLSFQGINVYPDTKSLHLPLAVTNLAGNGNLPGTGTSLLINNTTAEVMGALTGNGAVIGATNPSTLYTGFGSADYTFNGVVSSTGSQQVNFGKLGAGTMTLTGVSTSTGSLYAYDGVVKFSGAGSAAFGTNEVRSGAQILLDNSAGALNNRLGGNTKNISLIGGELKLITGGGATVTEALGNLNVSNIGGQGTITIDPAGGTSTTMTIANATSSHTGNNGAAFLFRGPGLGLTPASNTSNGTVVAPTNLDGSLVFTTNFRMWSTLGNANVAPNGVAGLNGGGLIGGSIGTPLVPVRSDALGSTSLTGTGDGFVTQDTLASGVRLLADSEYSNVIVANEGLTRNTRLSGAVTIDGGDTRFQTLTLLNGSSLTAGEFRPFTADPSRLQIASGGVFVPTGATASISAPILTPFGGGIDATGLLHLHVHGNLSIDAKIATQNGFNKNGAGTLTLGANALSLTRGQITINDGTLVLGGGAGENSFNAAQPTAANTFQFSGPRVNINRGTFDLNGHDQLIGDLWSHNALNANNSSSEEAGGILTSVAAANVTTQSNNTIFGGTIAGAITFTKAGNNNAGALTLTANNTYTGDTFVRAGTLRLRDGGRLSASPVVNVYQSTLEFDNTGLDNRSDRLAANATVNIGYGSSLNFIGSREAASQTINTLNLVAGSLILSVGSGQSTSAELTLNNLNRSLGAITFIQASNFSNLTGGGTLGNAGSTSTNPRVFINNLNGVAFDESKLNDGIIGGWATDGSTFLTYKDGRGVGHLGSTASGFAAYTTTNINDAVLATSTANVDSTANSDSNVTVTLGGTKTINALRVGNFSTGGNAAYTLNLGGNALTVDSGGVIAANNNKAVTISNGSITSGGSELFFTVGQNTVTVSGAITNAAGTVNVVKTGGGSLTLSGDNTFTGKLFVNNGTVTLSRTNAGNALSGNIDITGGASLLLGKSDQIADNAILTMNGGGTFGFNNTGFSDTIGKVILNGVGGSNQVAFGGANAGTLTLTAPDAITVVNDNVTREIAGNGVLTVNFVPSTGNTSTFNVSGASPFGIVFNSPIASVPSGGLIKSGPGLMSMNGSTNFGANPASLTEVFHIQEGVVRADTAGVLGLANHVTTIGADGALLGAVASITGSLKLNGGVLGATIASPSFSSGVNVAANSTINTAEYYIGQIGRTITLNGILSGSGNLDVTGPSLTNVVGRLALTNEGNTYSGEISLKNNAELLWQAADASGNVLPSLAVVNLEGGRFLWRDSASATVSNVFNLKASSTVNVDRTGASATNQTFTVGTLNVATGTHALNVVNANGYAFAANNLSGSGTLVKTGQGPLNIGGFTGFTGGITIAGAVGRTVAPTFNTATALTTAVNFTPASNAFPKFNVGGLYITPASKSFTVTDFSVDANPGNTFGHLAVTNTTSINATTFTNNGQVGSTGGTATIVANTFSGSGNYVTFGQALTLDGNFGTGALKVAGNNIVKLTGSSNNLSGAEVQAGTLRLEPTTSSTSTGNLRVFGSPAMTVAGNMIPQSAISAVLETANAISHTGNITNNGVVRVASGSTVVSGNIAGTAIEYVPGLREGRNTAFDKSATRTNTGEFGIKLEPRMAQVGSAMLTGNPLTGWSSNEGWVYTGYVRDDDGVFSFIENIDDSALIAINGVSRVVNDTTVGSATPHNTATSTAYSAGNFNGTFTNQAVNTGAPATSFTGGVSLPGYSGTWYAVEFRVFNGSGGGGAGFGANFGLGYKNGIGALSGDDYERPIDNGTGNLFVTPVGGKGAIQVGTTGNGAAVSLTAGGVSQTSAITLNGGASDTLAAALKLTGTGASDADGLTVAGTNAVGKVDLATSSTLTIGALTVPANGQLIINREGAEGTLAVSTSQTLAATSQVILEAGTLRFNGSGGTAGAQIIANPSSVVDVRGSVTGNLTVVGSTFTGGGSVVGLVDIQGGIVKPGTGATPGSGLAILTADSLGADDSSVFDLGIGGSVAGTTYDRVTVSGAALDLGNATLNLSLLSPLVANDILTIVMNLGGDTNIGMFGALTGTDVSGSIANEGLIDLPNGYQVRISYFDDASTPAFETVGGNDVSLLVTVPEPGSAMLLLGGLGSMMAMRRRRRNS